MINLNYICHLFECGHFCIKYILKKDGLSLKSEYYRLFMSLSLVEKVLKEYYEDVGCYYAEDIFAIQGKGRVLT